MSKRVLVSGGAGFIGSHVTVELIQAGYDVVVADDMSNCDMTCFEGVKKITGREDIPFIKMDFCDLEAVNKLFSEFQIDAVIHFAGLKAVGESVQKPWEYYENNIAGTLTLVDVMRKHGVKSIIFSSSVIRERRSLTLSSTGAEAFLYRGVASFFTRAPAGMATAASPESATIAESVLFLIVINVFLCIIIIVHDIPCLLSHSLVGDQSLAVPTVLIHYFPNSFSVVCVQMLVLLLASCGG